MRRIISLLLIFAAIVANARQITPEEAQTIASEFFNAGSTSVKKTPRRAVRASTENPAEAQPYYIFNAADADGFVIVSGDDRARKILGYSDSGKFDTDNMPPQLSWLLGEYEKQLASIDASAPQDASWQTSATATPSDGILLETANWGQDYPYNAQCPIIDGVQAPTGCVATAMAIVMKYHNWPEKATRSHKTTNYKGVTKVWDFSELTFDWDLMDHLYVNNQVNETAAQEVSKLMLNLGKALDMEYGRNGSAANDALIGRLMYEYFRYSVDGQTIYASNFTESEWLNMMHEEIDNGRPLLYGGNENLNSAGHEFVCDGYEGDMFHINWGWDGVSNGYFNINFLMGYNYNQSMVINICPRKDDSCGFDKYSEVFIDRAYDWGYADLYGICGLNMSVSDIEPNVPFIVNAAQAQSIDKKYSCVLALAIMSESGEIKGFLKPYFNRSPVDDGTPQECIWMYITDYLEEMGTGSRPSTELGSVKVYTDCTNLRPTDRIQLVSRRINDPNEEGYMDEYSYIEPDWKIVAGTLEAPTSRPVKGNKAIGMRLNWEISEGVEVWQTNTDVEDLSFAMSNCCTGVSIGHGRGLCSVSFDGESAEVHPNSTGSEIQIYANKESMDIKVEYIPYDELPAIEIDMTEAGTLADRLQGYDLDKIVNLTLTGPIDMRDFDFIREKIPYLYRLDLGNCNVCQYGNCPANTLSPKTCFDNVIYSRTITELTLPNTLEVIQQNAIYCSNLRTLYLPESLKFIDGLFVNFLYQNNGINSHWLRCVYTSNPSPFAMNEGAIYIATKGRDDMDAFTATLVVPKGAKHLYQEATGWKDFDEIREIDDPAVFTKYIDGICYVGIGDEVMVDQSNFFDLPEHTVIENHIPFNGREIPVTHMSNQSFNGLFDRPFDNMNYLTINPNMKYVLGDSPFYMTGTKAIFALNTEVMHIRFDFAGVNNYSTNGPKIYSPYLYENTMYESPQENVTFYYPGATPIVFNQDWHQPKEMWKYMIDKKNNQIAIIPNIDEIELNRVVINGKEAANNNNIYNCESCDNLDIELEYTLYGIQDMVTHYTPMFNASQPDSDLSAIEDLTINSGKVYVENRSVHIVNSTGKNCRIILPDGTIVYEDSSDSNHKVFAASIPGLYLVAVGSETCKVLIK